MNVVIYARHSPGPKQNEHSIEGQLEVCYEFAKRNGYNVIGEYDKIGHLGHLSLYKNQTEINTLFMRTLYNRADYKEVFSTDRIWIFDEWGEVNINAIFQAYDKKVFYWNEFC